jgi:hypothetical protein
MLNLEVGTEYDGVYLDATNGIAGTAQPIGTPGKPVSNLADALAIITARKLPLHIYVMDSGLVLTADLTSQILFEGYEGQGNVAPSIDFNGKGLLGSTFKNMYIGSETKPGDAPSPVFINCGITAGAGNEVDGDFRDCTFYDGLYGGQFIRPVFLESGVQIQAHGINNQLYDAKGKCTWKNQDIATDAIVYGNGLALVVDNTNTAGTITVYGDVKLTDTSAGTTVNNNSSSMVAPAVGGVTDTAKYAASATDSLMAYVKGLLGSLIVGSGTFTTSSALAPADTGKAAVASKFYRGCLLMPLLGACAFQPRKIVQFTTATGVFNVAPLFTSATGTVPYVILAGNEATTTSMSHSAGLQSTVDLEAATKNISATAKPAVADYSAALTIPATSDVRLAIRQVATQLGVTIDNLNSAGELNCQVYVDDSTGLVANNLLFDLTGASKWTSTGAKLAVQATKAATKPTIFNLLSDGTAHTFYFFFWGDHATGPTISLVQLKECVGGCSANFFDNWGYEIVFSGLVAVVCPGNKTAGTVTLSLSENASAFGSSALAATGTSLAIPVVLVSCTTGYNAYIGLGVSDATALAYLDRLIVNILE